MSSGIMETAAQSEMEQPEIEPIEKCNECNKEINISDNNFFTQGRSSLFGVYYDGKGICSACLDKHYEDAIKNYYAIND